MGNLRSFRPRWGCLVLALAVAFVYGAGSTGWALYVLLGIPWAARFRAQLVAGEYTRELPEASARFVAWEPMPSLAELSAGVMWPGLLFGTVYGWHNRRKTARLTKRTAARHRELAQGWEDLADVMRSTVEATPAPRIEPRTLPGTTVRRRGRRSRP